MTKAGVVLRTQPQLMISLADGRVIEALSSSKHWMGEQVNVVIPSTVDGRSKAKVVNLINGEYIPANPNRGDLIMARSHALAILQGVHLLAAGFYTPPYIKPDGSRVSSRIVINVRGNETSGNKTRTTDFQLTMWSGKDAAPGQGFAEKMARLAHIGKEFDCHADIKDYMMTVKTKEGVVCVNQDGSPVQVRQTTFVVDNSKTSPGNDAAKRVQTEVANYNALGDKSPASCGFNARPENWDRAGSPDAIIWKDIVAFRNAQLPVVGAKQYGYAILCAVPAGCTAIGMAPVAAAADVAVAAEVGDALPASAGDDFPGDAKLEAVVGDEVPF